ncbi:NADH dehydrogenase [ubiquinone] 1 beta subcomplex subunit 2-like [Iris pallida]|uniref:NADH dehydrogenase [ubiquinone] 1 beta subcomplex subunit 2-like n=1 Tax=Iris pallida TaxID=29817 RepID=A0AAX6G4Y9_IRIPA|nr:NADH dehydrogenase [ubiquinone] 1 beta subcomplex subunit 2-like [Iris pallida]
MSTTRRSAGTSSPARASAPSCGFGFCIGLSKMGPWCWDGGILGRDMETTLMGMIMRLLIKELKGKFQKAAPNSLCDDEE